MLYVIVIILIILFGFACKRLREPFKTVPYTTVMQTLSNTQYVPPKVSKNWTKYAPEVNRVLMNDTACVQFLKEHFGETYVAKFNSFEKGAHKADLFRYAWLYVKGGVYMDIKTEFIKPFKELFPDPSICYLIVTDRSYAPNERIYNGIIATPPRNPLMYSLLQGTMQMTNEHEYLHNCEEGFTIASSFCTSGLKQYGLNETLPQIPNLYVYKEAPTTIDHCDYQTDRYDMCMFIEDRGEKIIKVRYSDYPWE